MPHFGVNISLQWIRKDRQGSHSVLPGGIDRTVAPSFTQRILDYDFDPGPVSSSSATRQTPVTLPHSANHKALAPQHSSYPKSIQSNPVRQTGIRMCGPIKACRPTRLHGAMHYLSYWLEKSGIKTQEKVLQYAATKGVIHEAGGLEPLVKKAIIEAGLG
ncbi:hypothetical protein BS50DRAFT_580932 [Corynespora cassiicola Philippines]|uniref:Uncharacterized protein n=1 Tax=Corynespora cassiicola Philippines TaxID=1448308 RepID=A0A2T2P8V0_CORCC|nr:hypothetical protein BS50DRAFT_580932 [Corynespora cassiicola Philippines]